MLRAAELSLRHDLIALFPQIFSMVGVGYKLQFLWLQGMAGDQTGALRVHYLAIDTSACRKAQTS
jgi:hypothetical protein